LVSLELAGEVERQRFRSIAVLGHSNCRVVTAGAAPPTTARSSCGANRSSCGANLAVLQVFNDQLGGDRPVRAVLDVQLGRCCVALTSNA
jgi:hypothetical protein